jgi:hypothetical protein
LPRRAKTLQRAPLRREGLFFEGVERHGRSAGDWFELDPMIAPVRFAMIGPVAKDCFGDAFGEGGANIINVAMAVEVFAVYANRNNDRCLIH